MIDINLLPPEYGPKKTITPINLIIISLSFLICLSLLLSSLKLLAAVQDYSIRLDYHENQIKHYRRQVEDISRLAKSVQQLRARLSLVEELLREQKPWSDKLVELSQCMPLYGAWMGTITVEHQKPTPSSVTPVSPKGEVAGPVVAHVSGSVVSVDKISQFVASLENSETFGNIIFNSATKEVGDFGNDTTIDFKLSVEILALGGKSYVGRI